MSNRLYSFTVSHQGSALFCGHAMAPNTAEAKEIAARAYTTAHSDDNLAKLDALGHNGRAVAKLLAARPDIQACTIVARPSKANPANVLLSEG